MSAHETVSGQISSSCCLISSMTLNPRAEFKLGVAVFSPTKPGLSSSKLEPSQPFMEMEPEQGCWHASVVLHSCVHSALHNVKSIRTSEVVEGDVQLCCTHHSTTTDCDHGENQKSKTWQISHLGSTLKGFFLSNSCSQVAGNQRERNQFCGMSRVIHECHRAGFL